MYSFVNMSTTTENNDEKSWGALIADNLIMMDNHYAIFFVNKLEDDNKFIKLSHGSRIYSISKEFMLKKLNTEYNFVLSLDGYNFFKELICKESGESHDSLFLMENCKELNAEINYQDYNIYASIVSKTDQSLTNVIELINKAKKKMVVKFGYNDDMYKLLMESEENSSSLFSLAVSVFGKKIDKDRLIEILKYKPEEVEELKKQQLAEKAEEELKKQKQLAKELEEQQKAEEELKKLEEQQKLKNQKVRQEAEELKELDKEAEETTNKYGWKSFIKKHWLKILIGLALVSVIFFKFDDIKDLFSGNNTTSLNTNYEIIDAV